MRDKLDECTKALCVSMDSKLDYDALIEPFKRRLRKDMRAALMPLLEPDEEMIVQGMWEMPGWSDPGIPSGHEVLVAAFQAMIRAILDQDRAGGDSL